MVGPHGQDGARPVLRRRSVQSDGGHQAPPFSSRRWLESGRKGFSSGKVSGAGRADAGAGGVSPVEDGQRQASASVSRQQAGGSSLGPSKRAHSPQQVSSRSGWAVEPPRSRVEKRSAVDRVLGLSARARAWLGPEMVTCRKGRKRAAAPVNSQKKRTKKGYMDCWDVMDVIDGSNAEGHAVGRNSSTTERRRAFNGSSGFPSDND